MTRPSTKPGAVHDDVLQGDGVWSCSISADTEPHATPARLMNDKEATIMEAPMARRLLRIGLVVAAAVGAWAILWSVGSVLVPDRAERPGGGEPRPPSEGVTVSSGQEFGTSWSLAIKRSGGDFCVELAHRPEHHQLVRI